MQTLHLALQIALRRWRRQPVAIGLATAALALAIGAATTVVSVLYGVVWRPLPFAEPDRLLLIRGYSEGRLLAALSAPELSDLRGATAFEAVGGMWETNGTLFVGEDVSSVHLAWVTSSFFTTPGIDPIIGRHFTADEDAMRGPRSALISHALWQRRFNSDPNVVGRRVALDGQRRTIVGVMPPGLRHHEGNMALRWSNFDLWIPNADWPNRDMRFLRTVARIKPDRTLVQANAELAAIGARWSSESPARAAPAGTPTLMASRLADEVASAPRSALLALMGAVGAVLLIAGVNTGAILRARVGNRERELATHLALGASPSRVAALVAIEVLLCVSAAVAAGLGLAWLATTAVAGTWGAFWPRLDEIRFDPFVLAAACGLSAATALVVALGPVRQTRGIHVAGQLGSRSPSASGSAVLGTSMTTIGSVALALALLIGAGLLARTFLATLAIDAGFDRRHALTFRASVSTGLLMARAQAGGERDVRRVASALYRELRDRVAALPGVTAVGAAQLLPLGGGQQSGPMTAIAADGSTVEGSADFRAVLPGYFAAIGARIVEGRPLEDADLEATERRVVIDTTLAARIWPGQSALGRRLRVATNSDTGDLDDATVVGVVSHIRAHRLMDAGLPQVYQPHGKYLDRPTDMQFVVRTSGDPRSPLPSVREVFREVAPGVPVANVRTMDDYFDDATGSIRFALTAMSFFAALGIIVAIAGLYGLLSHFVVSRRREIGYRVAVGASPGDIVRLVAGHGARLTGIGVGLGLILGWVLSRFLRGLLFGVSPDDIVTFAAVAGLTAATGIAASLVPALRAAAIDPSRSLRDE